MTVLISSLVMALSLGQAGTSAPQAPASPTAADTPSVQAGRKQLAAGQVDEAVETLRKAAAAEPDSFDANLALGIALDVQLHGREARTYLQKALQQATDDTRNQALTAIAVSWVFSGDVGEASKFYRQVFDAQLKASNVGGAAGTANALGRVYLETGDLEQAKRWYETGHETARRLPDEPASEHAAWEYRWLHAQARLAARAGRFDEARAKAADALALVDRTPTLKDERATWYYLAGYIELYAKRYAAAIEQLTKGDARDPFVQMLLARSYQGAGDREQAREAWQRVLRSGAHNLQNAFARPQAVKALGKRAGARGGGSLGPTA